MVPVERRVGMARGGSERLCYALDSAALQLLRLRANAEGQERSVRRPRVPGERFVAHTLAISELYVSLIERSQLGRFAIADFRTEPASWEKDGLGGWLKPDAFVQLRLGETHDYWWIEVDLATESLPTVRRKLLAYLDFVQRGQLGPDGVVPRVLIGVPNELRRLAVQRVVDDLPPPADAIFLVTELASMTVDLEHILEEA